MCVGNIVSRSATMEVISCSATMEWASYAHGSSRSQAAISVLTGELHNQKDGMVGMFQSGKPTVTM